jgi:hypothetical protein
VLDELRPFEIIKLIRDRIITNIRDLYAIPSSLLITQLGTLVDALQALGWITVAQDDRIHPTERITEIQKALGISLGQLAPFNANSVVANPRFGRPSEPPFPTDVFVLMPFTDELKPIYEDHLKAVAKKIGATISRADDFFAANSIISDVWNAINRAKVIIADCTGRNPNVFYELGIAHTLGKPVILIAQSKDDIPFDVTYLRTILYDFTPRAMQKFESTLEKTLDRELTLPRTVTDALDFLASHRL